MSDKLLKKFMRGKRKRGATLELQFARSLVQAKKRCSQVAADKVHQGMQSTSNRDEQESLYQTIYQTTTFPSPTPYLKPGPRIAAAYSTPF